ncbi:LPXTG cell wall anchor domain-containing protein [Enterococcus faecium]|uniref:LPXTG cell wall anchor domain-containing protein n=1 Tax=Enterococcus faecium TaxID=1352 RepID=UPI001920E47D|nr:LPXTG cell wall anchor domain-containing protein [Enterococcus faecium]EGP4895217.1 LPXTG cell wall anchor domain-containing protein [Enterococcus faecium]EMF0115947.1 LPXTG cell wall anchor domain-containing protein [Enterococcus hirae]MBL3708791.1 LPXTG cell wall anchor domain-containing protein [Enterococcus faecium]
MWFKRLAILLLSCAIFNLFTIHGQAEETGTGKVQVEYLPNQVEETEVVESLPDYFFVNVQKNKINSYPQTNEQKNKWLFLLGIVLIASMAYGKIKSYRKVI